MKVQESAEISKVSKIIFFFMVFSNWDICFPGQKIRHILKLFTSIEYVTSIDVKL